MSDSDGATNSMSTGVYQTNNSLITSYPYNLSAEDENSLLRIRRTHGQYYQLNLEDEEVIPWYSLSANNKGENGGRRPQFNTWINSVNPYDVRNNYYTYSKGNITFSGTGEQRREYIHYPDSELKLFVNTIIKAERGANHRPTVTVQNLENGQQIARAQSKIEFNVIPRDIDLDLMNVTVQVSGCKQNTCQSLGAPIIYQNKRDNESFKVTLDKDSLSGYANIANSEYDQLKVIVYAIDENGAKSDEAVRLLDIVDVNLLNVSLSTNDENTRFLVGDLVGVVATFSRPDSYTQKYTNLNYHLNQIPNSLELIGEINQGLGALETSSKSASYNLKIKENNQFLVSDPTLVTIVGNSSYCIETCNHAIEGTQSLNLSIKKGQIRIKLISEQFSEQLLGATITIKNKQNQSWSITANSAGEFIVDNVPTGSYSLTVGLPEDLKTFEVIQQVGTNTQIVDLTQPLAFDINYENNLFEANFSFVEPQTNIVHGLYGGVDKENNQFEIISSEITDSGEDIRKEFLGGSTVNFAGMFTYKSPFQSVTLLVDENLKINTENIKLYEVLTKETGLELSVIESVNLSVENGVIVFDFKIPVNTEILIHYSAIVPDIKDGVYTNILRVGEKEKFTSIKSIKQIDENNSENLPFLF